MSKPEHLCPAQQRAYDWFLQAIPVGNIFHCWARTGRGRSTVLAHLQRALGGAFLTCREVVEAAREGHPLALEEALVADAGDPGS